MMNQGTVSRAHSFKRPLSILLMAGGVISASTAPLGTAFTYQGRLSDYDQPANGAYDFVFVLYDSPEADVPVYSGILNEDVTVTDGRFVTEVDFETDLFDGTDLWLEVAVRPGDETGDVTPLTPRHHLTATPYAHFARRAAVATTAESVAVVPWSAITELPEALADGANLPVYSAGAGIGLNEQNQLSVQFAGNGNAESAARSDHDHFGQKWTGSTNNTAALQAHNTSHEGTGLWGRNDEYGSGYTPYFGAGVFGDSSTDPGVVGFSNSGPGVYGWISAINGVHDAVKGENPSTSGRGVAGYATTSSGENVGVYGQTASGGGGVGVRGAATNVTGTSYGGRFSNRSPNGAALHANSESSTAAKVEITTAGNASPALDVRTDGKGIAGKFTAGNSTTTTPAVSAVNLGHGDGIAATAGGVGSAGNFKLLSNHTNNAAILATGFGAARGLKAVSVSGEAIRAESGGTAIYARAESGATALAIDGGAIRMNGAGVNTSTAAFIHQCTAANTPIAAGGNTTTIINHPMCNNNPGAMLFVTPRVKFNNFTASFSTYEDFAVSYNTGSGRWHLVNTSLLDEVGDFDEGDQFNVLVVLP